ncbi:hypothetical protein [Cellulomonas denverensis]|uniref:hypothetical protein n=1 Tax=Cellulomonas denverensis TaxID=264297 RepID=UPI0035EC3CB0
MTTPPDTPALEPGRHDDPPLPSTRPDPAVEDPLDRTVWAADETVSAEPTTVDALDLTALAHDPADHTVIASPATPGDHLPIPPAAAPDGAPPPAPVVSHRGPSAPVYRPRPVPETVVPPARAADSRATRVQAARMPSVVRRSRRAARIALACWAVCVLASLAGAVIWVRVLLTG